MMRNEEALHLFRISRRKLNIQEAGAHMLRAGIGGKGQFSSDPRSLVDASALLWKQGGFVDRLGDLLPQEQTSTVIETVVLSGIDAADARLLRRCRETGEVALYSSQDLGCDIEGELVAKIKLQRLRRCGTGGTVSAGV